MDIYQRIDDELADADGWWHQSTQMHLHDAARKLLLVGMGEQDAFEIIEEVYRAACNEFGT